MTAVAASVILAPTLEPPATARWSSYLPDLVLDELSRAPRREGARSFEAVVLFVDIKGFTTLSEAFARQGRRGSERLARAVGDFFDPLVDLARGYGGLVMEFSGDAMTVLFPHAPGRWRTAAARAARCALAMHAAAARTHVHPDAPLAVKAGLARGPLLARIVGDAGKRLVSVVTGEPLRAAVGAEKLAQTGETIVAPDLVFEDILAGRSAAGGHCALASVARAAGGRPHARQSPDLPDAAAHAVRFLPPPIAARLRAGHVGLLGEHREATALFAYAPGFGGGDVAAQVDTYFSSALEIVDRYGGWFVQADTDDNGLRSLVAFGAFVQHEDDADRALRCALALRELADGAIGIATGRVFCGPLGAHARHDCGILGDTVNVAARLASLAEPGETLVTDATSARTRRRFALGARRTITPRGKTEGIDVRSLRSGPVTHAAAERPSQRALPIVGRGRELATLESLLARAAGGRAQALAIAGEAGIGKTRLVSELLARARARGFAVCSGACESYGTADPYAVWRGVWHALFGLGGGWSPARTRAHLEGWLGALDRDLLARLPLLRAVLKVPLPDSELTRTLTGEIAATSLDELLLACLRHRASDAPVLLVLEDCHWIDADSLRLLGALARGAASMRVLVVATYRADADDAGRLSRLRTLLGGSELTLGPLAPGETRRLAAAAFARRRGNVELSPTLAARIERRAEGNPLYVEELVSLLHERPRALEESEPDLPDRLQSLVLARLDRLDESDKSVLKVASVAGRRFDAELLAGTYPALGGPGPVSRALETLARLELTTPSARARGRYKFRHSLIEEVLYSSLSIAAREELHEGVAAYLESGARGEVSLDALAHHYGRSARVDKQREYFRRAGDAAKERYASEAALGYYERLLPLLAGAERAEVLLTVGETRQLIGDWCGAEQSYRDALAIAHERRDEPVQADGERLLGLLLSRTQSYEEALVPLRAARDRFARLDDLEGKRRTLDPLAYTLLRAGDYEGAREAAEEQLTLAGAVEDLVDSSAALNNLGLVAWHAGDHERALQALKRSLDEAVAAGDRVRAVHASNDLAGVYWDVGDHEHALQHVRHGIEVAAKIGYVHLRSVLVGNEGELHRARGAYEQALACYRDALDIAADLGDAAQIARLAGNAALAAFELGRHGESERLLTDALARSRAVGEPRLVCEQCLYLGELLMRRGRRAAALSRVEEGLAAARANGYTDLAAKAESTAVALRRRRGTYEPIELAAAPSGSGDPLQEIVARLAALDAGAVGRKPLPPAS